MTAGPDWDRAAEGWDRHRGLLAEWLQGVTVMLLDAAAVAPGMRVLDIAAGAGDQTLALLRRVGATGQVLATDIAPRSLALSLQAARAAGLGPPLTRVADAQALGLGYARGGDAFDAAVCRLGLMFCREPLAALRSAHEALKPGGRFGAVVFAGPAGNASITTLVATARQHAGLPPAPPFEPGGLLSLGQPGLLQRLLAEAGYTDIAVRPVPAPMRLPSVGHYIDFVQTAGLPVMALLAPLPAPARQRAWNDITRQLQGFTGADGWVGPNELLLASASRP